MSLNHIAPDLSKLPGGWVSDIEIAFKKQEPGVLTTVQDGVHKIVGAVSSENVDILNQFFSTSNNWMDVSVQGMTNEKYNDKLGSIRTTLFNPNLSKQLFDIVIESLYGKPILGYMTTSDYSSTDCWQYPYHNKWELYGFSPMLRYMIYKSGGQHYAHYDAGFMYKDTPYRTLKSFVLYLSTNNTGATRFIEDNQRHLKTFERNHNDWSREVIRGEDKILYESLPVKGDLLIFDHRICHDVAEFLPDDEHDKRIIIRGDLIYKGI